MGIRHSVVRKGRLAEECICSVKRNLPFESWQGEPYCTVQVLSFIMRQVHYTDDSEMAGKTLELLNRLMTEVKLYRLECDVSWEAAKCSYEGMVGNE